MSYKGRIFDEGPGAYVATDVIVEKIAVRGKSDLLSVFVKLSAGALTSLELYESIDGSDWLNATPLAAYQSSSLWSVLTFRLNGAGTTENGGDTTTVPYPSGTLLQLRCVTAGVTVDQVLIVQDW
jgi:hypothetical protein